MTDTLVWRAGAREIVCGGRTLVMGVLNVTPDSFSDGGRFLERDAALAHGRRLAAEGADLIDVGGESTRPGAAAVPPAEEAERVVPVIERLAAELDLPISVDTRKAEVAAAGLEAGASIVNDVSGGADPAMFGVARDAGAGLVLMHMRGEPATMQGLTDYGEVVAEVAAELRDRAEAATLAGVERDRLCVDPGIGFAKTAQQNLVLLRRIAALLELGLPLLVGPSRKSFIGAILDAPADDRLEGTAGAVAWCAASGVHVVRVHDVKEMARVVRVVDAIRDAR